ncbi:hypothetical protein GCM10022247_16690 [Allokutzneria multivorans]|uniref:Uncharacterized protein n=1 Tax=Allokutzneria multivorans TaxID=1142134 RepID=A0ABP7RGX1_9PSEU
MQGVRRTPRSFRSRARTGTLATATARDKLAPAMGGVEVNRPCAVRSPVVVEGPGFDVRMPGAYPRTVSRSQRERCAAPVMWLSRANDVVGQHLPYLGGRGTTIDLPVMSNREIRP